MFLQANNFNFNLLLNKSRVMASTHLQLLAVLCTLAAMLDIGSSLSPLPPTPNQHTTSHYYQSYVPIVYVPNIQCYITGYTRKLLSPTHNYYYEDYNYPTYCGSSPGALGCRSPSISVGSFENSPVYHTSNSPMPIPRPMMPTLNDTSINQTTYPDFPDSNKQRPPNRQRPNPAFPPRQDEQISQPYPYPPQIQPYPSYPNQQTPVLDDDSFIQPYPFPNYSGSQDDSSVPYPVPPIPTFTQ